MGSGSGRRKSVDGSGVWTPESENACVARAQQVKCRTTMNVLRIILLHIGYGCSEYAECIAV